MNQVVEHAHCEICGRVVKVGTRFCSDECTKKHEEALAYKKRQARILLLVASGTLILLVLIQMGVLR
jgi:predicted nucleic acid-binding Zn ribbon protein